MIAFIGFFIYEQLQWAVANYLLIIRLVIWMVTLATAPAVFAATYLLAKNQVGWRTMNPKTLNRAPMVAAFIGVMTVGCIVILLLMRLLLYLVDPYATVIHAKLKLVSTSTIVASLTKMQRARDEDFRKYAAKGWVDVGDASSETVNALIELLEDPSSSVEIVTAKEMARLSMLSSALRSHLVEKVVDKSPAMRKQAIATLNARIPDWHQHSSVNPIVPKLVIMTYVDKDHDLEQVMTKIGTRWTNGVEGEKVSQALVPIISNEFLPNGKRIRAMMVGEKIGPRASHLIPALRAALDEESREVRLQAIKTLEALGVSAQPALPDLHRIATSGREDALEALRVIDLITAAISAEAHSH